MKARYYAIERCLDGESVSVTGPFRGKVTARRVLRSLDPEIPGARTIRAGSPDVRSILEPTEDGGERLIGSLHVVQVHGEFH